ncbi:hypothetical protein [Phytohabitans suffuscus]|uniref:Uncharacterized protein n=1 Tax=Phytohabitans suffuscus TaxID=624315 RepID=A0A6F8YX58_9ACTN|nr:hypothetical protein [Phytohabitans suffuscus]BCB90682.1 hypothetical protein Psuf_079950 [Phytohabitans suffuscus]
MDVARVVLEYVKVLIWPAVVLVGILLIKRQLPSLLSRFRAGEVSAAGMQMRIELAEVTAQVVSGEIERSGPDSKQAELEVRAKFNEFFTQGRFNTRRSGPANLVIFSFMAFLQTVATVAARLGLNTTDEERAKPGFRGTHEVELAKLVKSEVIGPNVGRAMERLGQIYGKVVEDSSVVDEISALEFRQTAMALGEAVVMGSLRTSTKAE